MVKSLTRFLLILLGPALYLALAIAGWGGFVPFFEHPPFIALTIVLFALSGAAGFTKANISPGIREDRGNRWVITALSILGLLDGYLPALTDRLDFWTVDGEPLRWIGVVLFAAGGTLRLWPVFVLGRRFSGLVAIQPGHTLVTTGIYRLIRHPSYLGLLVTMLGWGLAFRSLVGVILTLLSIVPVIARIHSEENLLLSQFGEEYERFRAQTKWRLVPRIY